MRALKGRIVALFRLDLEPHLELTPILTPVSSVELVPSLDTTQGRRAKRTYA